MSMAMAMVSENVSPFSFDIAVTKVLSAAVDVKTSQKLDTGGKIKASEVVSKDDLTWAKLLLENLSRLLRDLANGSREIPPEVVPQDEMRQQLQNMLANFPINKKRENYRSTEYLSKARNLLGTFVSEPVSREDAKDLIDTLIMLEHQIRVRPKVLQVDDFREEA